MGFPQPTTPSTLDLPYVAGTWYPNYSLTYGTLALTTGKLYAYPFLVTSAHTFLQLGNWCTAGGTTAVLRFGIYADNRTGGPGALILDAGTVNAATGAPSLTAAIAQLLTPGLVHLAVAQSSAVVGCTVNTDASTRSSVLLGQTAVAVTQAESTGWIASGTGTTGALPAIFPAAAVGVVPAVLILA